MSMVCSHPSSVSRPTQAALTGALFASVLWMTAAQAGPLSIAVKAFDLRTGAAKRSVPLPDPHSFCNDIAVDAGGAVYVTDSANPIVLRLPAGATGFEVFATNPQFAPPQRNSAGLARKGESPALPFRIYAVPLNKGQFQ